MCLGNRTKRIGKSHFYIRSLISLFAIRCFLHHKKRSEQMTEALALLSDGTFVSSPYHSILQKLPGLLFFFSLCRLSATSPSLYTLAARLGLRNTGLWVYGAGSRDSRGGIRGRGGLPLPSRIPAPNAGHCQHGGCALIFKLSPFLKLTRLNPPPRPPPHAPAHKTIPDASAHENNPICVGTCDHSAGRAAHDHETEFSSFALDQECSTMPPLRARNHPPHTLQGSDH